jgi:hypothetical protein
MSLIYHSSGSLQGKYTADSGGDLPPSVRASITLQRDLVMRMDEPAFAATVRLAARADSEIQGGETALEQIHRHRLVSDQVSSGLLAGTAAAGRVLGIRC